MLWVCEIHSRIHQNCLNTWLIRLRLLTTTRIHFFCELTIAALLSWNRQRIQSFLGLLAMSRVFLPDNDSEDCPLRVASRQFGTRQHKQNSNESPRVPLVCSSIFHLRFSTCATNNPCAVGRFLTCVTRPFPGLWLWVCGFLISVAGAVFYLTWMECSSDSLPPCFLVSLLPSFIHPFIPSLIPSFLYSSIPSFLHSFIHASCLLACFLSCLLAFFLASFLACLLACFIACLLPSLLACFLASFLPSFLSLLHSFIRSFLRFLGPLFFHWFRDALIRPG